MKPIWIPDAKVITDDAGKGRRVHEMNYGEIVLTLRLKKAELTGVELADLLNTLIDGNLSQGTLVTYFKRTFPSIPLRVLLDASAWERVSGGGLNDEAFNEMLRPWLEGTADNDAGDYSA